MQVEGCWFPDHLLYDPEHDTWARIDSTGGALIGINSLLVAIAGKISSVRLRPVGTKVVRGQSLGTVESLRFVGPIPAPLSGIIVRVNNELVEKPRLLNDSPYETGWIAEIHPLELDKDCEGLVKIDKYEVSLRVKIRQFHVRCFKALPDHEMYEIGVECSAVLARLNELIVKVSIGDVIHLVTDDPTAYVEIQIWNDRTKQEIVEWRKERDLYHFIIRKTR